MMYPTANARTIKNAINQKFKVTAKSMKALLIVVILPREA